MTLLRLTPIFFCFLNSSPAGHLLFFCVLGLMSRRHGNSMIRMLWLFIGPNMNYVWYHNRNILKIVLTFPRTFWLWVLKTSVLQSVMLMETQSDRCSFVYKYRYICLLNLFTTHEVSLCLFTKGPSGLDHIKFCFNVLSIKGCVGREIWGKKLAIPVSK